MRTLVIGAAGYLGSELCRKLLNEGNEILAVDNFDRGSCDALLLNAKNKKFKFIEGDVTDFDGCKKWACEVDNIVNLAAVVGFPACKKRPHVSYQTTVKGAENVVKAAGNKKVVFSSTCSVYGHISDGVCHEEIDCKPTSLYGEHKLLAEDIYRTNSNATILRFSTALGVSLNYRVSLLVNDLVYQALNNKSIVIFESHFSRAFIYIDDMIDAMIFALKNDMNKQYNTFNVGDNNMNYTKRQVAEMIKERTGCYVLYEDIAKDADSRNYVTDFSRINGVGFNCKVMMDDAVDEIIRATPLIRINHQYQ